MAPILLLVACSHGTGSPARQADGGYSLSCKGPLSDCLHHAERLCRDAGYTVAEARDVREVLGGETGQSRVLIQKSDATVYCGTHAPRPPIELKREPEPVAVTAAPAPAPPKPAPVCVPGATQACVGPAGCNGGQTCSVDGSHFETCDCGSTPH
jgi:hypothetical protein